MAYQIPANHTMLVCIKIWRISSYLDLPIGERPARPKTYYVLLVFIVPLNMVSSGYSTFINTLRYTLEYISLYATATCCPDVYVDALFYVIGLHITSPHNLLTFYVHLVYLHCKFVLFLFINF